VQENLTKLRDQILSQPPLSQPTSALDIDGLVNLQSLNERQSRVQEMESQIEEMVQVALEIEQQNNNLTAENETLKITIESEQSKM
jgi:hypothetical protein